MAGVDAMTAATRSRGSAVLTVGFGMAVAMWAVGYVGRLPAVLLPSPALLVLFLLCLLAGGYVAGRFAAQGIRKAAVAGRLGLKTSGFSLPRPRNTTSGGRCARSG